MAGFYSGDMRYGNCYYYQYSSYAYAYDNCHGCNTKTSFCGTSSSSKMAFTNSEVEVYHVK